MFWLDHSESFIFWNYNNISHIHRAAFKTLTILNFITLYIGHQIQTLDTNIFMSMNGGLPFESSAIVSTTSIVTKQQFMLNITIVTNYRQILNMMPIYLMHFPLIIANICKICMLIINVILKILPYLMNIKRKLYG